MFLLKTNSFAQKIVIGLLRLILPPHVDNEQAADYLRTQVAQNDGQIAWTAVRPDNLTDEDKVTPYDCIPPPFAAPSLIRGRLVASMWVTSWLT